jgi:hypothetical protein
MEIIFTGLSLTDNIIYKYDNYNCINLYYLYNYCLNVKYSEYHNILNKNTEIINITDVFILNTSYDILFENFKCLEYIDLDFNKILHIYIFIFCKFNKCNKIINNNIFINKYIPDYLNIKHKLIIRPGIVELRACSTTDNNLILNSIYKLSQNINNEEIINNIKNKPLSNWIAITHDSDNYDIIIATLMTNAGFYFYEDKEDAFNNFLFFKNGYINALYNSDFIMHWSFVNCYALNILNEKKKIKECNYIDIACDKYLIQIFNNKNILFLTCFKKLVDIQYNSGNIYKIHNTLTNIKLDTIETYLTTYPNKKHKNFIETYTYYTNEIDIMFSNNNYDIFTCACGCYGLLLCNYVYTKYNITSLYIGNCINTFFGISHNNKFNEYYIKSDLNERYTNINYIDNNSYGYTN